jgi:hypothetical protein
MTTPAGHPDPILWEAQRRGAELEARTEIRSWYQTEAAGWRERLGNPLDERRSMADIDHEVEQADRDHRERYGRGLRDGEKDAVRMAAEQCGRRWDHSPVLDRADYDRLGFGYDVAPERVNRGIAVRTVNGWVGDPAIAARADELERERAARDDYLLQTERPTRGVPR